MKRFVLRKVYRTGVRETFGGEASNISRRWSTWGSRKGVCNLSRRGSTWGWGL